jgi:uncharacterized protein (TIGR00369 family)
VNLPTYQDFKKDLEKDFQHSVQQPIMGYARSPFIEYLGIRSVRAANGEAEVSLSLAPHHLNVWEIAHGGVTMTLLDLAMGGAVRSLANGATGVVTVEMKTNFMQPGNGTLRGLGRVLHQTAELAYCEGELLDEQDRLIAKALGTFKYLYGAALKRRTPRSAGYTDTAAADCNQAA